MFLYFYFISVFLKMEIDKFTHSWVSSSIQVITWRIIYHADVCRGITADWPFLLCEFSLTVTY